MNPTSATPSLSASTTVMGASAGSGSMNALPIVDSINLLPYRDQLRQAQRREAAVMLAIAGGVAIVGLLVAQAVVTRATDNVARLNGILSDELREIDNRVGEIRTLEEEMQVLMARQSAIAVLQRERMQAPLLLAQLTDFVPPTVYVSTLAQKADVVTLTGVSASNQEISALLANMGRTAGIRDSQLMESRTSTTEGGSARPVRRTAFDFTVKFTHDGPQKGAEDTRS